MYCESLLFAITPTVASVPDGATIPLAQIARRVTPRIELGSDSVIISQSGYYKVNATVTCTAPATGVVSVELHKNGTAVAGITASETISTATTEVRTLPVMGIVRVFPNETAVLTLVNSGVAINSSNVALSVERVA